MNKIIFSFIFLVLFLSAGLALAQDDPPNFWPDCRALGCEAGKNCIYNALGPVQEGREIQGAWVCQNAGDPASYTPGGNGEKGKGNLFQMIRGIFNASQKDDCKCEVCLKNKEKSENGRNSGGGSPKSECYSLKNNRKRFRECRVCESRPWHYYDIDSGECFSQ